MFQSDKNPTLSSEEFYERLKALSGADNLRIRKISEVWAARCGLAPDDLFQEAVTRVLEGSRNCPSRVGVVPFLAQVMRSLSSDENKAKDRAPNLLPLSALLEAGYDPPAASLTPENQFNAQQSFKELWDKVCALFHDDEISILILEYQIAGYEAEEIRKDLGLDQTAYDSKRRFIRRRFDRLFKKEGQV